MDCPSREPISLAEPMSEKAPGFFWHGGPARPLGPSSDGPLQIPWAQREKDAMQAIVIAATGGPEVLGATEVSDHAPGPGELLVRVEYAGVNFIDIYKRAGLYPMETPFIAGEEGSGVVAGVGQGVSGFAAGDRVAWSSVQGAYAEMATLPADRVITVPDRVPPDLAAAVMLQGMTAHYLVNDTYPLQAGDRCLIHAGAGGVGRLLVQMAKRIGAEVFTTVGSDDKTEVASAAGADHVINYGKEGFRDVIEAIAGPRPLDVVYDGVGAATFDDGLALLRRRGTMATYGNASGAVPPLEPLRLMREGSVFLTRPTLGDYIADRDELLRRAGAVLGEVADGTLEVLIGRRYRLAEAADAHRALESRATVGKIVLATS